jgi:hypothetical protein
LWLVDITITGAIKKWTAVRITSLEQHAIRWREMSGGMLLFIIAKL